MNALTMTMTGETDLTIKRRFNAPPEAVYDSHVNVEKLRRWMLGPEGWTMPSCELDPRPGGAFAYTWKDSASDDEFTIRGRFVTLDPPHRIEHIETMEMGDMPSPESRVVTEFIRDDAGTLMTMTIHYDSAESRQAAVESGMEEGMAWSYNNLEEMVRD